LFNVSITPTFILFLSSEACLSPTTLCENYYEEVMKTSSSHKEHNRIFSAMG